MINTVTSIDDFPCVKCNRQVISDAIECSICNIWCHRVCAKMSKKELITLSENDLYWYCIECMNLFPYHHIDNDEFCYINSSIDVNEDLFSMYKTCKNIKKDTLKYNDFNICDFENKIDPQNNYYNEFENKCDYYTNVEFCNKVTCNDGFSLIHFNCRSLKANAKNINSYIDSLNYRFDVIALTETWLNKDDNVNDFNIEGYDIAFTNRKNKRGGGVMLFVSKLFDFTLVNAMSVCIDDLVETVTVELDIKDGKNVLISCMYRSPGGNVDNFNTFLSNFIGHIGNKNFIMCGDYNINLLNNVTHKPTQEFIDTLLGSGIYSLIDLPTRVASNSSTLIDNIFTNIFVKSKNGVLIDDTVSDHLPIFSCMALNNKSKKHGSKYKFVRCMSEKNFLNFNSDLIKQDWGLVYDADSANSAYENFIDIVKKLFENNFPYVKVNCKKFNNKPWLTKSLLKCCRRKNNLYKKFITCRSVESELKYKQYKNRLTNILRQCEKQYYNEILYKNSKNTKNTWHILNDIMNRKKCVSSNPNKFVDKNGKFIIDKAKIANGFNDFFVNVGPTLANGIINNTNSNIHDFLNERNNNSIFLEPVVEGEVLELVKNCANKNSTDCEGFSMSVIKKIIKDVIKPFTFICNYSFSSGVFPERLKIAKVIPLFKAGDKSLFTNYRPVSLLPQFSKILEKLFSKRLNAFIEKHNILNNSQYGFRNEHSTSLALIELIEQITLASDCKKSTIGVFIDLKKAFDTINHDILLNKLQHYGIRGVAHKWLDSYIKHRKQFVSFNDVNSDFLDMVCGVPQGSILGPILFIIYINDLCNVSTVLKYVLFADDTNLFISGNDLKQLCSQLNIELDKLNVWFMVNKLSLNISKTNFILFSNKFIDKANLDIRINGNAINRVFETKFLGVIIDSKLNWKQHIAYVKTKLNKCIGVIYKASYVLDTNALRLIYCSLYLPYLSYCCEVWGTSYKTATENIVISQKKVVRIINKVNKFHHTRELFLKLKLLKFRDIVDFKIAVLMFKASKYSLPYNVQSLFCKLDSGYTLRSKGNFSKMHVRTTKKAQCISVYGVNLFNNLNNAIKNAKNIFVFKRRFKKYTLLKYVDS